MQVVAAKVTDTLINYETVKYFTNEHYEAERYLKAMREYQSSDYVFSSSMNLLNV